jgi:CLIP-associating protein 1/2
MSVGSEPLSIHAILAAGAALCAGHLHGAPDFHHGGYSAPQSPATWEDKVEVLDALAIALRTGGTRAAAEAASAVSRIAELLAAHLGDAHHRVALAALEAAVEAVPAVGVALEPYLDRLCPALFPRLVDPKEAVRGLASAALAAVGDAHAPDAILPALLRSLDVAKAPRAKTGVLEFALYVLSGQGGGTDPSGAGRSPVTAGSHALAAWVARVAPLTADRHVPLRAAAAAGLAAVHTRADTTVVLHHLASLAGAEAAAVCRAVAPHAPSFEAEFNAYAAHTRSGGRAGGKAGASSAPHIQLSGLGAGAGAGVRPTSASQRRDEAVVGSSGSQGGGGRYAAVDHQDRDDARGDGGRRGEGEVDGGRGHDHDYDAASLTLRRSMERLGVPGGAGAGALAAALGAGGGATVNGAAGKP